MSDYGKEVLVSLGQVCLRVIDGLRLIDGSIRDGRRQVSDQ
jgi:hypothetical protein